mmetsp:Transcript_3839/g.14187  ORF Transcript_3839/g.14187 Transcript_3839/m.14187 type:complete len:229 (+) Transcript_3839:1126-1812(+)
MFSASSSQSRPKRPFSPHPQEYTSPAFVNASTWSVPLAVATARLASQSGTYRVVGVRQICSPSGVKAYSPEDVRKVPQATIAPSAVTTATCESPVDKSTAIAALGRSTKPGVDSEPATSLFAKRPNAPSSFTPQEYTRPPSTIASVCMPPHAIFITSAPLGTVLSHRGRGSSSTSSPNPSCPPSPVPKTKHRPLFSWEPATDATSEVDKSSLSRTSLNSVRIRRAYFL